MEEVRKQFKEEEQLGLMKEYPQEEFLKKYGANHAVSALAVIEEDGGKKIRVLHDGTHKTMVNHKIKCRDKVRFPGVAEKHTLMRERKGKAQIAISLLADFTKAHRWVKIIPEEHGMLACQIEEGKIWTNESETFGISSAAYWWSRLAGATMRAVQGITGRRWMMDMLLFADDLEITAANENEREGAVMTVFILLALGAPLKWKKFRGGYSVDWIGLHLCNYTFSVGLSQNRAEWLIKWILEVIASHSIDMGNFAGGLGRINFAATALYYEKPWLGPLYSWASTVFYAGKEKAVIPWGIKFILQWISEKIKAGGRLMKTPDLPRRGGELFRSDAKAEDGKASVGGWECKDGTGTKEARWWYLEITKSDFEWAFAKENDPQRVIATLELLGTLLSIILFNYKSSDMWASSCTISADTDNQGVSLAMHKFMSTKWPLTALLAELSEQLRERQLELHLRWVRRDLNVEADAITNGDFTLFEEKNRIRVEAKDIPWIVLPKVMCWSKEIYDHNNQLKAKKKERGFLPVQVWRREKLSAAKRLKTADPW